MKGGGKAPAVISTVIQLASVSRRRRRLRVPHAPARPPGLTAKRPPESLNLLPLCGPWVLHAACRSIAACLITPPIAGGAAGSATNPAPARPQIGMSLAALIITGKYLWYSMDAYYTM